MIFRLFNFFIHLPPSLVPPNKFTSPSWVCLRSPQAIKRGLWPQRNFPFCCSLSACPPTITVCCLSPAAARRQSGSCSKGRNAQAALRAQPPEENREEREGRTGGFFPRMRSWMDSLSQSELSFETRPDPPLQYTSIASSYHVRPQNHCKPFVITTQDSNVGPQGATLVDSAAWISLLESASLLPRWEWLVTECRQHTQQTNALTQLMKPLDCFISRTDRIWNDWPESLQRQNVATTGRWRVLLWLLSLFSACVSHGGRRSVAFVPRCEIHHSFPEPPSPPWISGMSESTKALSADNGASILNVTHPCGSSFQTSSNSLPLSRFSWSYSQDSAHTVVATGRSRSWIFTFPSFTFASPPVPRLPNGRTIFFRWARIRWSMSPVHCVYTGQHDELPLALGWSNGTS